MIAAVSILRPLTLSEVEILLEWARMEGWNPGLADASAFHAADPEGFIGCFVEGRLTAGISAIRYGDDFGFIGLYIVHPDFRGRGLGRKVWDAGMAHLTGRIIGLDGVPEQQANYRNMGFKPVYETFRWSGVLFGESHPDAKRVKAELIPDVLDFDRHCFPARRDAFLDLWLRPPRIAMAIMEDGEVRAYAVCRRCHDGYKVGPLFAGSFAQAERLLQACAVEAAGENLHLDIPASQFAFATSLESRGFTRGFVTARMYCGQEPPMDMAKVFAISTLELG